MIARIVLALVLCGAPIITTGCATGTAQHPGSINAFDSQAYDTLITIQAAIEEAKKQFADSPAAKEPLDKVRAAYNLAMKSYKVYHTAGKADPAKQAELQKQIAEAASSLASFRASFKEKP